MHDSIRYAQEKGGSSNRKDFTHTWSTGFKFDALRRAPEEVSATVLLALAPRRAIILPAEAIVYQCVYFLVKNQELGGAPMGGFFRQKKLGPPLSKAEPHFFFFRAKFSLIVGGGRWVFTRQCVRCDVLLVRESQT